MDDFEPLGLSLLSQADYCLRRAALLMNENVWVENAETAKGRAEHEKVHTRRIEHRGSQIKLYEYEVFSEKLGLRGLCDCVEATEASDGCRIPSADFPVSLYPIEYKHGNLREESEYKIQLCAQAMCLEEMYDTHIAEGAIFYISVHKRLAVNFDAELRQSVIKTAERLRAIKTNLSVPPAVYSAKCNKCSLSEYCMPKTKASAENYINQVKKEALGAVED